MKKILSLIIFLGCISTTVFSQESDKSEKASPKSLMSSYYKDNFNPFEKNNMYVSLVMSLKSETVKNKPEGLETIIDGKSTDYSFGISTGYYFSDNFAAALGFDFGQSEFSGLVLSRNDTINKKSLTDNYSLTPTLRSSIPLVPSQRLSIYVDLGFGFGWGNTVTRDENSNGTISKSYADNFSFGVGINPGIVFFVMENFAMEIGVNLVGYNYSQSTVTQDEDMEYIDETHEINFKLNLLKLNLALSYYIGTKK